MSSVVEFVRRHRNKILFGGAVAGAIYIGSNIARRYYEEQEQRAADRNLAAAATASFGGDRQRLMLQNRRHYIFDSNQRTCDNSLLQIIPSLKTKLQNRFDVESMAENLKRITSGNGVVDNANKIETWNKMKVEAVTRIFSSAVAYSLAVLSLKAQISILAEQIYEHTAESTPNKYESWYSRLWYNIGGTTPDVKPRTGQAKPQPIVKKMQNSSAVQQLFLQALQYFTSKGVDLLTDQIEAIVQEFMVNVSLKTDFTVDHLRKFIADLRGKVLECYLRHQHFSFYVVPIAHTGTLGDAPDLEELLILLKTVLESPDAQRVFEYGVQCFTEGAIQYIMANVAEYRDGTATDKNGIPLARLISPLTDAFHDVSRVNFDSIINNFIISTEVHEFCVKVFERDQGIW